MRFNSRGLGRLWDFGGFVFFFAGSFQHRLLFFFSAARIFFHFRFFSLLLTAFYDRFFGAVGRGGLYDAFTFGFVVGGVGLPFARCNGLFIENFVHQLLLVQLLGSGNL